MLGVSNILFLYIHAKVEGEPEGTYLLSFDIQLVRYCNGILILNLAVNETRIGPLFWSLPSIRGWLLSPAKRIGSRVPYPTGPTPQSSSFSRKFRSISQID